MIWASKAANNSMLSVSLQPGPGELINSQIFSSSGGGWVRGEQTPGC